MSIQLYKIINETCTDADREECKADVYRMYDIAQTIRKAGLLYLESEIEKEQNIYLKTGMLALIDGVGTEYFESLLRILLSADGYTGKDLLRRMIICQGLCFIRNGDNPRVILKMLSAILGEKYIVEIENERKALG